MLQRLSATLGLCPLLAGLAIVAGCASPMEAFNGPPPEQLASQAFASLETARATHLTGSFANAGRRFSLACTTNRAGDAQGNINVDGRAYELLVSGGQTYVRGQGFWAAYGDAGVSRLYGDSWVALQATGVSPLGTAASPCAIGRALGERRLQLKKDGEAKVGRQQAVELSDASGKIYVTAGSPTRLLRIVSSSGYRAPDGTSDVRLDFDYPKTFQANTPGVFINPSDPKTFPAHYSSEVVKIGKCDASGCMVAATVRNLAGPPAGQSTATFKLRGGDDSELGSCTVNLPPMAYQQAQDVSCTVSGASWSSFFAGTGDKQYFARLAIQNPPYDG